MSKLEWGKKHICSDCSTKFYDMNKPTPECPNCGSQVLISRKPRVGRPPLSQKISEQPKVKPDLKKNITSKVTTKENLKNNLSTENVKEILDIDNIEEIKEIEELETIEPLEDLEEPVDPSISKNIEPEEK